MKKYDHRAVEQKWQKVWEEQKIHQIDKDATGKAGNFYILDMFPYPSADGLHMGHTESYTASDIYYRFKRMQGFNVLHPQGFDSFGLPAENFAIKTGTHPAITTENNMKNYLQQWKMLGLGHDFENLAVTSHEDYYKWTQWLFGQFFKHDLVYKKTDKVNWCPSCNTILANEQVEDGKCERCKTVVIQKDIPAWFFKITRFADDLIEGLDTVDWPEATKKKQIHWIGKSEGSEIDFAVEGTDKKITVFTTRADTLFGVTYVVLAPEHPLVNELKAMESNPDEVTAYQDETQKKTELTRLEAKEKTGVCMQGVMAKNPANGELVPVWVADYVLARYGTGAVMAVPAHDERDFEFATAYKLPKKKVVDTPNHTDDAACGDYGTLCNSGKFDGMMSDLAKKNITREVGGKVVNQYRLRDWSISRQRYWGCPIPMVYDKDGSPHYVGNENLPWSLPTDVDFVPTGTAPLAKSKELQDQVTKLFGEGFTPEVDTLDTFVDSSWYFYRYPDTLNEKEFCSTERMNRWLSNGVDLYIGGAEHTYMHLLYARFFGHALYSMGYAPTKEPFKKLRHQGMVNDKENRKMSKSKGNVVNPNDMVDRYGADAVRTYMMFAGPLEDDVIWNEDNIVGVYRFLEKVYGLVDIISETKNDVVEKELHKLIKQMTVQLEELKYNTAVSDMMKFINAVTKEKTITKDQYATFLKLLSPYAPHIADELSETIDVGMTIDASWPTYDEALAKDDVVTIGVQINGKRRADVEVGIAESEESVMTKVKEIKEAAKWLAEGEIKKVIYVPGKILNIIVG